MSNEEFPSNARSSKSPAQKKVGEKKVHKVVKGEAKAQKKPLWERFKEIFIGGDSRGVGEYVLMDVLIPAAKDMIADAVSQGVERKLFGDVRSSSRRGGYRPSTGGPLGHVSYHKMSEPSRRGEPERSYNRRSRGGPADNIWVPTRAEASEVLDTLAELIDVYEVATVADLYELVGMTADFTYEKFGWVSMHGFDVRRAKDGYVIVVPAAVEID